MIIILELNKIYLGDNLELLKQLEPNSIHSCVSDFPYNLGFMGKKWDTISNYQDWCYQRAKELLRVLKPGGYCLIFGGTRTHHRLVCAFEDAGFQIKDEIQWIYCTGMPKSFYVDKKFKDKKDYKNAKQWEGWGVTLKPSQEPIMVAQKPIENNYCYNIKKYGVGGINIDSCRISFINENDKEKTKVPQATIVSGEGGFLKPHTNRGKETFNPSNLGRYPTNIILDELSAKIIDNQYDSEISRFFYCPKASKKDKTENGLVNNTHVTVKPTELIKYLVKLVTPKDGICLDICEGSGTHVKAILQLNKEGFNFNYIGFENDEDSYNIACQREKLNK